jgi:murein DD-endopeptidase MepM/ murein hydrolase activator NlpD
MAARMRRPLVTAALFLATFAVRATEAGPWGNDVNSGDGPKLVESVRADLAAIVKAPAAERDAKILAFATSRAADTMEAVKRFRNLELLPLFHLLLEHEDWHVVHRTLLALERYPDPTVLPKAWALLKHAEPRLREKAAITCLRFWEPASAKALRVSDPAADVATLWRREPDPYVRACLDALIRRVKKDLPVERVSDELRVTLADGLVVTPFLEGMENAKVVAPTYASKPNNRMGGGSAEKLPVATRWVLPLLGWGKEEVPGVSLQPFGNPRSNGAVFHTGLDVGACMDGAGFYAAADGIVRMVHSGSDMGTLVCIEHHVAPKALATVFFMHAADLVFVVAGDRVAAGQLVASMGFGYSFENGGHFAHLHIGAYPGPFSPTHNFGYRAASAGLRDWFDPATFLPEQVELTRPPVDDPGAVDPALDDAADAIRAGRYRDALAAMKSALAGKPAEALAADAKRLEALLTAAGPALVERANTLRAGGHPVGARQLLATWAPTLDGVPDGDAAKKALVAWDGDAAFARDRKAEEAFDDAVERERAMLVKHEAPAKIAAMWQKLLDASAGTSLVARMTAKVAENAPK